MNKSTIFIMKWKAIFFLMGLANLRADAVDHPAHKSQITFGDEVPEFQSRDLLGVIAGKANTLQQTPAPPYHILFKRSLQLKQQVVQELL